MRLPAREQLGQLSPSTIFQWTFLVTMLICIPWSVVNGVLALLGYHTVQWNSTPLTGFLGLIAGPFLGLLGGCVVSLAIGSAILIAIKGFGYLAEKGNLPRDEDDSA